MASTASPRDHAPSGGLTFVWVASGAVIVAVLLASFRLGFAFDVPTLLVANGPRVLLAAAAGAALALSGALRLATGSVRPWQDLEIFAVSAGAGGGGFLLASGRTGPAAYALFLGGSVAGGALSYAAARALDRPKRWTNFAVALLLAAGIGAAALAGSYGRQRRDVLARVIAWLLGDLSGGGLFAATVVFALAVAMIVAGRWAITRGDVSSATTIAWLAFGLGVGCAGPLAFVSAMVPLAVKAIAGGVPPALLPAASAAAGAATVAAVDAVPRLLVGGYDFPWNVPAGMLAIPGFLTWNLLRLRREAGRAPAVREWLEVALIASLTAGAAWLAALLTRTIQLLT